MIKYVSVFRDRDKDTRVTFETQGFAYEFIADFPKYPVEDWQFIDVLLRLLRPGGQPLHPDAGRGLQHRQM